MCECIDRQTMVSRKRSVSHVFRRRNYAKNVAWMNFPAELHYTAVRITTLAFHTGNYSDAVSTAVYNSTT